jgi:hypothetical protein
MEKNTNLAQRICGIYYANTENVSSVNEGSDRWNKTVSFSSGTWTEIKFTPGTGKFSEQNSDSKNGNLFNQSLEFFFPGEDESNSEDFNSILNQPVLVKIVYTSGQEKLIGSIENPCKLKTTLNVGNATGRKIMAERTSDQTAFWLE